MEPIRILSGLPEKVIEKLGVRNWPVWEKEVSDFAWYYEDTEHCLILEGTVEVETADGDIYEFGAGDFVTFAAGLSCDWKVLAPVKKHYTFGSIDESLLPRI